LSMVTHVNERRLILVVDDEVDITDTYAMYLDLVGFEVMTANNALQALEIISTRVPDLIISDCMMPYMDGVEFSVRVKAQSVTSQVPIILMSGAPELHNLDSPSYEVFLRKPVLFDRLIPEIRRLLE
jgi:DNA-binding response OmpR family regulator